MTGSRACRTVECARQYLVETYVAGGTVDPSTTARAREAAEKLSRPGEAVRHLRSILLPEDETCFHLFEGEALQAVERVSEAAGLGRGRIVEAISVRLRKELEMRTHKRDMSLRWIAVGLAAGAVAIPAAQVGRPDDRPLYRGTSPAAVLGSMSQDDRNFNRGTSQSSTSVSMSPDDRSYYRGGTADLSVANVPSSSITPDDRSFTRQYGRGHVVAGRRAAFHPTASTGPTQSWAEPSAWRWPCLGLGALLFAQRHRTLRPA